MPKNGAAPGRLVVFDEDEPLEPIDSVFASSAEKFCQCLPEGRLDVVDVGEKGLKTVGESAWNKGGDLDGL
jgi:hypothetical protein